jgi:hypothetical protein
MGNTSATPRKSLDLQNFEPLSVRGSAVEFRIAHALEGIAAALCRIDQRLAALVDHDANK